MKSVDVTVTGQVQGVSFRAYCRREAERLDVVGHARNNSDGSVTCHFEGSDDAVDQMVRWCRSGSPMAQVEDVEVAETPQTGTTSFTTG